MKKLNASYNTLARARRFDKKYEYVHIANSLKIPTVHDIIPGNRDAATYAYTIHIIPNCPSWRRNNTTGCTAYVFLGNTLTLFTFFQHNICVHNIMFSNLCMIKFGWIISYTQKSHSHITRHLSLVPSNVKQDSISKGNDGDRKDDPLYRSISAFMVIVW